MKPPIDPPAGFKRGTPYWSPDGGVTWIEGEPPPRDTTGPGATVTEVDIETGTITVEAN